MKNDTSLQIFSQLIFEHNEELQFIILCMRERNRNLRNVDY